jgi:hypothetical protein
MEGERRVSGWAKITMLCAVGSWSAFLYGDVEKAKNWTLAAMAFAFVTSIMIDDIGEHLRGRWRAFIAAGVAFGPFIWQYARNQWLQG